MRARHLQARGWLFATTLTGAAPILASTDRNRPGLPAGRDDCRGRHRRPWRAAGARGCAVSRGEGIATIATHVVVAP